jgi:hypothetical protein
MATHRALEAAGIPVTASAPMSGPYALAAFSDAMFLGEVGRGAAEEVIMLVSSYQHSYGNIYTTPTDIFAPQYALADTLLPGATAGDDLVTQGLISEDFLALLNEPYRAAYIQDALTYPDGGYPNTTNGLPPLATANPMRAALTRNDLRNWAPIAPTLLCAGDEDPVVFYMNTQLMEGYWAVNAPLAPVTVLDVDAPPGRGGPYKHIKKRFAETKKLMKWIEGRAEVGRNYHDVLVPAFCLQAARSFFEGY